MMTWHRLSPDTIGSHGYLITRTQHEGRSHFTAWAPGCRLLLSYWGEGSERAKAACEADMQAGAHD